MIDRHVRYLSPSWISLQSFKSFERYHYLSNHIQGFDNKLLNFISINGESLGFRLKIFCFFKHRFYPGLLTGLQRLKFYDLYLLRCTFWLSIFKCIILIENKWPSVYFLSFAYLSHFLWLKMTPYHVKEKTCIVVSRQPVHSRQPVRHPKRRSTTSCDTIFQYALTNFVLD